MGDVYKSIKDIPEIQEPKFDDSIYKNKSIKELDDLGFSGWHNTIIARLRNSGYDKPEAAVEDARKRGFGPKEQAYVKAYANAVFGVNPSAEEAELDERTRRENEAIKKYLAMGYSQDLAQQKANVDVNYDGDFEKNYPQPGQPDYVPSWLKEMRSKADK